MKTKFLSLCIASLLFTTAHAQDYPGFRTGNYTGVHSVFFNPANIVDSRYRFDVNLFSANATVGNNQASFSLKNIGGSFNSDSVSNKIFGENAGKSSGLVSADFHGPSLMFNAGKKMAFAFTTRARVMANITDMDGKLVDKISNGFSNESSVPYTISSTGNMRFNVNAWTEYGVSAARVISNKGKHFFKAGITFKYLAGAGNAYMSIENFNGTLNEDKVKQDNYLANTTGSIVTGFGGISVTDFDAGEITKMESKGFGADIGFVYEYRPAQENYIRENGAWKKDLNKYRWKVSVALLDLGSIKYEKDAQRSGAYKIDITGSKRFYLSELDNVEIDNYKAFFNSRPQIFTPDNTNSQSSYKVSLPSTLQINADYHLHKGFYINLASQLSLINSANKPYNSNYFNSITLTPRFEGKALGLYIPVSYNELTKLNAGASLRLGPLFIGSGSLLTALFGNSKQADAFVGLRFGRLQKNMEKKEMRKGRQDRKEAEREKKKAENKKAENSSEALQQN